ncbi:hypothetical protein A1OE_171 [Candidatus Endolissoclinum faulkneri L2]|uniref:Uncharacterized protein n=1 Tax=Candidatus Endolissoclinum faulkneri L2 TaxID=1193729 RepID=K7YP64_9PROT|nr:hypothetical protein A1OE_171 [Candidatus Endolissoclinum faulkneri L2]
MQCIMFTLNKLQTILLFINTIIFNHLLVDYSEYYTKNLIR